MLSKASFSFAKIFLTCSLISSPWVSALADTDNPATSDPEKVYLIQIINQLDAIRPLLLAAKNAQAPDKRVQFHYAKYQDNHGQWHNGLLEDVQSIKAGITQYLNQPAIEPRAVQPLQSDYLDLKPVQANTANLVASNTTTPMEAPHAGG